MSTIGTESFFMPQQSGAPLGAWPGAAPPAPAATGLSPDGIIGAGLPGISAPPGGPYAAGPGSGLMDGLMGRFLSAIAGLLAALGQMFSQRTEAAEPARQTLYRSADASSHGDPHEAFSGTTSAGKALAATWDDMHSHEALLSSDSFAGGYRVATTATAPNAAGVTLNASAAVITGNGATRVALDASGDVSVESGGRALSLQPGATLGLGDGETVRLGSDGAVVVTDDAPGGGTLVTTMHANGNGGVDVSAHATNVDLGGYLTSHAEPEEPAPMPASAVPVGLQNAGFGLPYAGPGLPSAGPGLSNAAFGLPNAAFGPRAAGDPWMPQSGVDRWLDF